MLFRLASLCAGGARWSPAGLTRTAYVLAKTIFRGMAHGADNVSDRDTGWENGRCNALDP